LERKEDISMRVKVFSIGLGGLEEEINSWLTANPNIKAKYVGLSVDEKAEKRVIVLVFYEGEVGEGKLDFSSE